MTKPSVSSLTGNESQHLSNSLLYCVSHCLLASGPQTLIMIVGSIVGGYGSS